MNIDSDFCKTSTLSSSSECVSVDDNSDISRELTPSTLKSTEDLLSLSKVL